MSTCRPHQAASLVRRRLRRLSMSTFCLRIPNVRNCRCPCVSPFARPLTGGCRPGVPSVIVDAADVDRWFSEYLNTFAACGRGETGAAALLAYYGVPFLLSTDEGFVALSTGDEVTAAAQRQVDGMRSAGYDHSVVLELEVSPLNTVTALCRGHFSRRHRDGTEIGRLTATYLVTGAPDGRRISALAVHSL